jgi:hypothetical protein
MINIANPLMWSHVGTNDSPLGTPKPLPEYYKGDCKFYYCNFKEDSHFYSDSNFFDNPFEDFHNPFEDFEDFEEREEFYPLKKSNSYEILGIDREATIEEIKQAFRKKALEFHPDKCGGDGEMFIKIREAYETLTG